MMPRTRSSCCLRLALGALVIVALSWTVRSATADEVVYSPFGSDWKFLPGLAEASSPDSAAWRLPEFDDASWASYPAPIGYASTFSGQTNLAESDSPMKDNYTSFFARREIAVSEMELIVELHAILNYDDGILVWINGQEVFRDQVPGVPGSFVPFDETATGNHRSSDNVDVLIEGFADYLVNGTNVIAVQLFNNTIRSSDVYFDMELLDPVAPDRSPPLVTRVLPPPGSILRGFTAIEVFFDEEIAGIDAGDLEIGGRPASSVTSSDPGVYLFEFDEPAAGVVDVRWTEAHDIVDAAPLKNSFEGGEWSYTLDHDAPLPRVVINEILAANGSGLKDKDGDEEDWIEILNLEPFAVNLAGWSLTDDLTIQRKWIFPDVDVPAGESIVIFASEKDQVRTNGEIHTNFKLDNDGEHLGFYTADQPPGTIEEFLFPSQRFDYSYGRSSTGEFAYFSELTPGAPNSDESFPHFVADPVLDVQHGFFSETFPLTVTSSTPDATIYFTLHGNVPTPEDGMQYTDPIAIEPDPARGGVVTVRAAAYKDGLLPSRVVTATYIFPERVFDQPDLPEGFPPGWTGHRADYGFDPRILESDPELALEALAALPTLSVVTDVEHLFSRATGIYANPTLMGPKSERPTSAELIYPDGRKGFQIDCGIRMQGRGNLMNWNSRKMSMRLLFKGDYGATKLRFPLFPNYRVTNFDTLILDAGLNNTWATPEAAPHPSYSQHIRDQFTADLQREMGGRSPQAIFVHMYLNGLYWGMYYIHERMDASWASQNFGCEKVDWDSIKHQQRNLVNGTNSAYDAMIRRAKKNLQDPANYQALGEILDLHDFADYILLNFYLGNIDWGHQNWYATRKRVRDAKWRFHSWDAERTLENLSDNITGRNDGGSPSGVFQALRRNPEFSLLFADHAHRHLFNGGKFSVDSENPIWTREHPERNIPASIYMRRADEVNVPIFLESARWGDQKRPGNSYKRADWLRELRRLIEGYFPRRTGLFFRQLGAARLYPRTLPPVFNQHGGKVDSGFALTMEAKDGVIYYTLNGEDPRVPGGEISSSASQYSGPVVIDESVLVKARALERQTWSALNEATFDTGRPGISSVVISEIMYNPTGGSGYEFVEINNTSDVPVDLSRSAFTNGIEYTFPDFVVLASGEYLVLAANINSFRQRYPDVEVAGQYQGRLDNAGEKLTLRDSDGNTMFSVDYDNEPFWPIAPDGFGPSLVLADAIGDPDDPRSWRASAVDDGSPGLSDSEAVHDGVFINEILTVSSDGEREDFIELANLTNGAVNVGGWFLSPSKKDAGSLRAFRIPDGTVVEARDFLVLRGEDYGFVMGASGGAVYLSSASAEGELTGLIEGAKFGAGEAGVSFGRFETSTRIEFTALSIPTPGEANGPPRSPAIAINEIHYHPPEGMSEFVEFFNPTENAINISSWKVSGVSNGNGQGAFTFADGTTLDAGRYALLVPVDPAAFRAEHGLQDDVQVIGPYAGGLNNAGERLRLRKPAGATAEDGFVLVDMVRFNDREPWPEDADGIGPTLERIGPDLYGNDAYNWAASRGTGGTPGSENTAVELSEERPGQVPGDLSQDGRLNITDAVLTLHLLFRGQTDPLPCEGDSGQSLLDANGDATVDISDAVHLLDYLFREGAPHALGTGCVAIEGCEEVCTTPGR